MFDTVLGDVPLTQTDPNLNGKYLTRIKHVDFSIARLLPVAAFVQRLIVNVTIAFVCTVEDSR